MGVEDMRKVFILAVFILSTLLIAGSYGGSGGGIAGTTWTQHSLGTDNTLENVAYGNNTFVAVDLHGIIFTSQDGVNWTQRNSRTRYSLYDVAYGNNTFVAVGNNGIILTSP
jgi:hypothetical protein